MHKAEFKLYFSGSVTGWTSNPALTLIEKDRITIATITDSRDSVRRQYHSSAIIERLTIAHALLLAI
jgi:hypothetical protein